MKIDKRYFNPVYWHIDAALKDPKIRTILTYGGSSSSKTYSITQSVVINSLTEDNSMIIFRKVSTGIRNSVYADFAMRAKWLNEHIPNVFEIQAWEIRNKLSGAKFVFKGLDDTEKIKGIAGFKRIYLNELSEFHEADWDEANRRLRGRDNQQIIADWNPIDEQHWIKTELIDKDTWVDLPNTGLCDTSWVKKNATGDTILIKTSYRDNFWVVGSPCGTFGNKDEHALANFEKMRVQKPNQYQVYGLGEWGTFRVGGEFWKQFDIDRHVQPVEYLKDKAVHVSVDVNVLPYISQSLWQVNIHTETNKTQLRQFAELCARDPENTATKAAQKVARYLQHLGHNDLVFLYGDASGSNRSAIDNTTFYAKYLEELRKYYVVYDRIMTYNPSVSMSAAFINDIYEGITQFAILIGDNCLLSKQDYNIVKEDKEGKMLKPKVTDPVTGQSYEPNGHLSDAKRYFICKVLAPEYEMFLARQKNRGVL